MTESESSKVKVLTFVAHYLPSFKSGGPVRTISNMALRLEEYVNFKVVTLDRDAGDSKPFDNILMNEWTRVGVSDVLYLNSAQVNFITVKKILINSDCEIIYLNSFFNFKFSILPLIVRKIHGKKLSKLKWIVAPRGELSPGALSINTAKKKIFILFSRIAGLHANVVWHVSSNYERSEVISSLGVSDLETFVAPNLPSVPNRTEKEKDITIGGVEAIEDRKKVLFLSRISPKKNLEFAIRVLNYIEFPLKFNIYGPIRDARYWERCKRSISRLPANIEVEYHGSVEPGSIPEIMKEHDLFFLPTLGENYGHVIPEALLQGTPVLISNMTPWRGLEQNELGYDLALEDGEIAFAAALVSICQVSDVARSERRSLISKWAINNFTNSDAEELNKKLFLNRCV